MYGAGLRLLRFFFLKRIIALTVLLWEQFPHAPRRLTGNILHGNTLADVCGVVRMALCGVDVQIPDELVVDNKALGFIFARPLRLVHVDVVDQLVEYLLGQRPHFHELTDGTDSIFKSSKRGLKLLLVPYHKMVSGQIVHLQKTVTQQDIKLITY